MNTLNTAQDTAQNTTVHEKISDKDIAKLAAMSRISLAPAEQAKMKKDIGEILSYVEQVQKVPIEGVALSARHSPLHGVNVMRADTATVAADQYTDDLIKAAPKSKGRFVHVKKIIGSDH